MATSIEVAKLVTRLTTESSEFNKGLMQSEKMAASWALKVGKITSKLALGAMAAGAAAVGGAAILGAKSLAGMAKAAAPLPGIADAFNRNAQQFGVSMDAMRKAAAGTVSDFELMKNANMALTGAGQQLGEEFGKQLPTLMAGARAAAAATGQSADFLFQSLVTGVKRSSPLLIDNTGIVLKMGEANAAMAAKVGKSVKELTSQEKSIAILNATVEATNELVARTGGAGLTTAEKVAGLGVQMQNLRDQMGIALNPVLGQVTGSLLKLVNLAFDPLVEFINTTLAPGLSLVVDIFDGWINKLDGATQATAQFVNFTTDGMGNMVPVIEDTGKSALGKMTSRWAEMAEKALRWGINVATEFASGLIRGATQALTAAMHFIGNLLSSWLAPGSPPKIMPNLDKWAQSAMNLYLHSMTQADFGILEGMQGPLSTALSRLVDAGEMSQEGSVKLFRSLSEGMSKALAAGKLGEGFLNRLSKAGGAYGKDLAELAKRQFKLAQATTAVKEAEEALERARTAQKDAQNNVEKLAREYNELLAAGADPAVLEAKRAEFEAAQDQLALAEEQADAAEAQKEEADKALEPLQEQVAVQQKILDQMFKMTEPMSLIAEAIGKLGDGIVPEIEAPTFDSEGIANNLGKAFEDAKEGIRAKLQDLFKPVTEAWEELRDGPLAEFKKEWERFTGIVQQFWTEKVKPVIDEIKKMIPPDVIAKLGQFAGVALVVALALGALFVGFTILTSPIFLVGAAIAAVIIFGDELKALIENLTEKAGELGYKAGVWLREKVNKLGEAFQKFKDEKLQPLIDGFVSLWKGIKEATTWFGNLWDKIKSMPGKTWDAIKMFLGHSPSPLEKGFRGVADAMADMTRNELPAFSAELSRMPQPALALAGLGQNGDTQYNMTVQTNAGQSNILQDWDSFRYRAGR